MADRYRALARAVHTRRHYHRTVADTTATDIDTIEMEGETMEGSGVARGMAEEMVMDRRLGITKMAKCPLVGTAIETTEEKEEMDGIDATAEHEDRQMPILPNCPMHKYNNNTKTITTFLRVHLHRLDSTRAINYRPISNNSSNNNINSNSNSSNSNRNSNNRILRRLPPQIKTSQSCRS
jgi:hypothetical protein